MRCIATGKCYFNFIIIIIIIYGLWELAWILFLENHEM